MSDRQGSYIGRDSHHVGPTWNVSKGFNNLGHERLLGWFIAERTSFSMSGH